ncbi:MULTISPECIES: hypothetical protein [unclassified Corallococcus]|uniref:hypothetical protein n=1 Tax=unclassified Corallococcus TaxID=2685029 RepID=UPI001A8E9988|nr:MULTISPECIES: hypothetical protein [unclassified Corallococcus]MBN9687189.1 hypothetical protein [Corallococcus sp. NCSPR001]WAS88984.1 hypothetical protein O0N60_18875 [Corallococcus sp. NCRR]
MSPRVAGHRAHAAPTPVRSPPPRGDAAPQVRPQAAKPASQPRATGHERKDSFESARPSPRQAALEDRLRSSDTFRQLPRGTQARLLATARKHGQSPEARRNIADLALNKNLDKLAPRQQREAIKTLREGIKNKGVGADLAELASDKDFRRLGGKDQRNIMESVAAQRGDRSARNALVDLGTSKGFGQLNGQMRKQLVDEMERRRSGKSEARFGKAALELADSASFRKLAPDVQSQLAKAIAPGRPPSQASRSALVELGSNAGLAKLPAETQRKVLEHLPPRHAGQEAAVDHLDRLTTLVDGGEFAKLRPELQGRMLDALRPGRLEPEHEQTLADLGSSKGFAALSAPEQDRLFQYVSGTNPLSRHVQTELGSTLLGNSFQKADAAGQAEQLRTFLREQPGVPELASVLEGAFPARPYALSGPTEVQGHSFPSGPADALRYEVEIEGQRIPVFVAKNPDASRGAFHSIEEVAEGLATLPPANRALVKQVDVDGKSNPQDAYWEQVYNQPGFRSYMTAGAEGIITIYPSEKKQTQAFMDSSLIHETGHTLSHVHWGSDNADPRWDGYRAAMASDGFVPSDYARSSPSEDFAETLVLYQKVRGTPQEAEVRALMPGRFRLIDDLLSRPPPAAQAPPSVAASRLMMGAFRV